MCVLNIFVLSHFLVLITLLTAVAAFDIESVYFDNWLHQSLEV